MESNATINVRMSGELKRNGTRVLDRAHVSPTELVKSVYRYMEKTQEIPACLDVVRSEQESIYDKRRRLLREISASVNNPDGYDVGEDRARRIEDKYGDLL